MAPPPDSGTDGFPEPRTPDLCPTLFVGRPVDKSPPESTFREIGVPNGRPGAMRAQPFETAGIADLLAVLAAVFDFRRWSVPSGKTWVLSIRRTLVAALVILTTGLGAFRFWTVLRVDGATGLELVLLAVFAVLLGWIAFSFWLVVAGAYARWYGGRLTWLKEPVPVDATTACVGRTAVLVPVYNEEWARLFAGVRAICESLIAAGGSKQFDVFLLSDSSEPDCIRAERDGWRRLRDQLGDRMRLFYRRRERNIGRKSGNIADFCRRWGGSYDYMIVLDADSLMAGPTMVRLARLMDANARTALIQVPPMVVGRSTLFARIQQFASSVYGPLFAAGLAYLQGPTGNYWGHNAIIRIKPFMAHCGLPVLPGRAPLGGEILSHDFVEAALLRRAGWEVWLAPELGGSYEEPPPTFVDHLARDRRWCQGNLQHARLLLLRGLRAGSRLHFALGVMSYVSSPLWLLLLILSVLRIQQAGDVAPATFVGSYPILALPLSHVEEFLRLILVAAILLYGPKLLAWVDLIRNPERRMAHGGGVAAGWSVLCESAFATLLAPITMLSHSWFVLNNLIGRSVGWTSQCRDDRCLPLRATAAHFLPHTAAGITAAWLAYVYVPESLVWLTPLLAGPLLAVPLVQATSSVTLGTWARRRGLFLIPSETGGVAIVSKVHSTTAGQPAIKAMAPRAIPPARPMTRPKGGRRRHA